MSRSTIDLWVGIFVTIGLGAILFLALKVGNLLTVGNTPASNASGLSTVATDAQCNIATEFKLWYRTKTPVLVVAGDGGCSFVLPDPTPTIANPTPATPANSCFQPYVPGTTPAASVAASLVTVNGVAVPYIVRVERGTLNRGIYDIAVLFDPTQPTWTWSCAMRSRASPTTRCSRPCGATSRPS